MFNCRKTVQNCYCSTIKNLCFEVVFNKREKSSQWQQPRQFFYNFCIAFFFLFYRYDTSTLAENYSGAAHYGNEEDLNQVLRGIGLRSVLLILVSSLCLVLASIGVCICLRKSNQMQCCDAALLRWF